MINWLSIDKKTKKTQNVVFIHYPSPNLSGITIFFRPKAGSYPEPEKKSTWSVCLFAICLVWENCPKHRKICDIFNLFSWNSPKHILSLLDFDICTEDQTWSFCKTLDCFKLNLRCCYSIFVYFSMEQSVNIGYITKTYNK